MSAVTITLTYPPSANHLWRNVGGKTLKSAEYRSWLSLNTQMNPRAHQRKISGRYRLTILATAPDNRRRDLGNIEKAISDCLQYIGAIEDDCHCRELRLAWHEGPGSGVTCTIEPVEA